MPTRPKLWKDKAEPHDYPAAEQYLSLIFPPARAKAIVASLKKKTPAPWKAKDILRASRLPMLEESNAHVKKDRERVRAGEPLSPVLLVRGDALADRPLIIADGYHRVCASWYIDEDTDIPCQIADARTRS